LDIRGKKFYEDGENYVSRSFVISTSSHILLEDEAKEDEIGRARATCGSEDTYI
jgi:hypothetical protein